MCFRPHSQAKILILIIILAPVGVSLWLFVCLGRKLQLFYICKCIVIYYYHYYYYYYYYFAAEFISKLKAFLNFISKKMSYPWRFIFFNFSNFFIGLHYFYSNEVCACVRVLGGRK